MERPLGEWLPSFPLRIVFGKTDRGLRTARIEYETYLGLGDEAVVNEENLLEIRKDRWIQLSLRSQEGVR